MCIQIKIYIFYLYLYNKLIMMKGEINTIFLININDINSLKGIDGRYHYFYKIINTENNYYYYGIHTTDNLDDNYKGSGNRLNSAYKKYGLRVFTKYILKFFNSRKELLNYEKEIVTEKLCNKLECYNIAVGGNSKKSLLISVRDNDNNWLQISRKEFLDNPNKYKHHSKGRIVLNNGILHKYVLPNELDKYLSEGWIKGEIEHYTSNRISINKNNKQKLVLKEDLDKYLSEGWIKGGISRNKNAKSHIKGFIWINKNDKQIRINEENLDKYLSEGWIKGVCQKTTKGYVKLTNGINNVSIDPNNIEEINYYLNLGWNYGVSRIVKKHIWINDLKNSKMILEEDLDNYLSEGWVKGRLKEHMPKKKENIIVISKNGIAKQIYKNEFDKYIKDGWVKGNCNIKPVTNNGKIVINNGNINKFINPNDLDKYLSDGWVKGKIKKLQKS